MLELKTSPIHGMGIFTTKAIAKNEHFYTIPLNNISNISKPRLAYIGKNRWVSDEKVLNWVNHSCEPNIKIVLKTDKPYLAALRNIQPGEELTCCYDLTETNGAKVPCTCTSGKCKGFFISIPPAKNA